MTACPIGRINMMTMENLLFGSNIGGGHGGNMDTSGAGRGVSAIHRRAQQLKKWQENEDMYAKAEKESGLVRQRSARVKFSDATLFLAACATSDYDECKMLIDSAVIDINVTNIDGLTALHQACIDDNVEMVKFLIEKRADVNACDNEGWTPLHATSSCGHVEIAEVLLDAGADPRIINNEGELATDLADNDSMKLLIEKHLKKIDADDAESLRKQEVFVMMQDVNRWLQNGAIDDKAHPRTGAKILHVAAAKGYISVISTLLNNKMLRSQVDVNVRDNEAWTPLHAACYWQQPGAVELLLQNNADIEAKTGTGQSLDDLTDHDLIRSLIDNRRKKLKEEQAKLLEKQQQKLQLLQQQQKMKEQEKLERENQHKLQLEKENQQKVAVVPPSSPSTQMVPSSTPTTESETQRKAAAKRARETRRSTQGVSADDVNKAKEQLKHRAIVVEDELDSSSAALASTQSQQPSTPTSPTTPQPSVDDKDYKKLYEDLLSEYEKLKKDFTTREQDWNRTKRQQLRKISEYEEEVKSIEQLEADNQRLKDENGALIRVISKLSK
ncbi:Protein phosphatase 1 regulatory subunit 12B [Halotydeus destructor]|nr:Protein phosphatase 1 regulatory subunit 12B [Halotydeus destructor]